MKKYIKKSLLITMLVVMLLVLTATVASASGGTYHTVRYGETLFSIGRYYGVNPYRIAEANNLWNPNYIYAGQVLYIPAGYQGGYYPTPGANRHVVCYGETLSSIARRYGVTPWAIARANGIYNMNLIYSGQVLYIPLDGGSCGWYQQPCYDSSYSRSGYYSPEPPPIVVPY
ncbi:MAG: LysM peptidoglycan-binding domain-containing protein [Anaerolineae bacterium]|nr:LysM peptidoglycan-binding domain-containing protein [Anaerolineae bacterium]